MNFHGKSSVTPSSSTSGSASWEYGSRAPGSRECLDELYEELARRELRFRPHAWLSYDWFVAGRIPGIAIPFYLAHPRLMKLERRQMLEVEGGTREEIMKILRHECGHALDNAYGLGATCGGGALRQCIQALS